MDDRRIEGQVASVAGEAVGAVGAMAGDAMTEVEELASQGKAAARQAYRRAGKQAHEATAAVATSVEQRPFATLLTVGLICGAVGFLLGRR
jgi:uncharacterized protein YjbJ (UPF0337 family)